MITLVATRLKGAAIRLSELPCRTRLLLSLLCLLPFGQRLLSGKVLIWWRKLYLYRRTAEFYSSRNEARVSKVYKPSVMCVYNVFSNRCLCRMNADCHKVFTFAIQLLCPRKLNFYLISVEEFRVDFLYPLVIWPTIVLLISSLKGILFRVVQQQDQLPWPHTHNKWGEAEQSWPQYF